MGRLPILAAIWVAAALPVAAADLPRFAPGPCPFEIPAGEQAACGTLLVAENPAAEPVAAIRLPVAILRSTAESPAPDPVVYVAADPSQAVLAPWRMPRWWRYSEPLRAERDFILMAPRGAGTAEPRLDCPEIHPTSATPSPARAADAAAAARQHDAARACHRRHGEAGIDLSAYDTAGAAADIAGLARALDLDRINVLGVGHGGRVARELVRRHPERVRAAILDSPQPEGAAPVTHLPRATARRFRRMFADCAAQPECARAFPQLESHLATLLASLDREPVVFDVQYRDGSFGLIDIDAAEALATLFRAAGDARRLPWVPAVIVAAARGDIEPLAGWVARDIETAMRRAEGRHFTILCREVWPNLDPDLLDAAITAYAPYGIHAPEAAALAVCPHWPVGLAETVPPADKAGDVPVLVLIGGYDPFLTAHDAEALIAAHRHGRVLTFPGLPPDLVATSVCAVEATIAFLARPRRPDLPRCITEPSGMVFSTTLPGAGR